MKSNACIRKVCSYSSLLPSWLATHRVHACKVCINIDDTHSGVNGTGEAASAYGLPTATGLHDSHAASTWRSPHRIRESDDPRMIVGDRASSRRKFRVANFHPAEYLSLAKIVPPSYVACDRQPGVSSMVLLTISLSHARVEEEGQSPFSTGTESDTRVRARVVRRWLPRSLSFSVSRNSLLELSRRAKSPPTTPAQLSIISCRLRGILL